MGSEDCCIFQGEAVLDPCWTGRSKGEKNQSCDCHVCLVTLPPRARPLRHMQIGMYALYWDKDMVKGVFSMHKNSQSNQLDCVLEADNKHSEI